jgi:hypothetical protein
MQLVRSNDGRHLFKVNRDTPVRVLLPVGVVIWELRVSTFEDHDILISSDAAKRTVGVHQFKWIERRIHDLVFTD